MNRTLTRTQRAIVRAYRSPAGRPRGQAGSSPFCIILLCAASVVLLGACRSAGPPPTTQMAQARTALEQAQEAGAGEYAAMDLRRAQQKFEEARAALSNRQHVRARRLAEQAAVDAELASIRARSAKTQEAVTELRESIRALQQEALRGAN